MYQRPDMITPGVDTQGQPFEPRKIQEHFEDFYEDIFEELGKFDEIESLNICDNLADHMISNVYVQFKEEDQAAATLQALQGHFYSDRPIIADFSPVTNFHEATCRQFEENNCNRGGYCNFMHVKMIGRDLRRKLFGSHILKYRRSRSRRAVTVKGIIVQVVGGAEETSTPGMSDSSGGRRRHVASPKRSKSPVREGSEERRARIEQWNQQRKEN
ncbi:unnamed protein product [Coffea canephora]|uniref:DH200=94 genomic scaffold, scaffold_10191 n=1 Tax=Coffea canephora TaxID=49390 RepID=A0A068VN30_COFCA|nr:unnamed protein product [Coffea canephora]